MKRSFFCFQSLNLDASTFIVLEKTAIKSFIYLEFTLPTYVCFRILKQNVYFANAKRKNNAPDSFICLHANHGECPLEVWAN